MARHFDRENKNGNRRIVDIGHDYGAVLENTGFIIELERQSPDLVQPGADVRGTLNRHSRHPLATRQAKRHDRCEWAE